jgi:hypothetical protein
MNQLEASVVIVSDYAGGGAKSWKERLSKADCQSLASTCVRHLQRPVSSILVELDASSTKVVPAGLVLNGRVSKWRLRCVSPQMF